LDNLKIAVIGSIGKWSTEALAQAIAKKAGTCLVVDMSQVVYDLSSASLRYQEQNLCEFDALVVKKVSSRHSSHSLDKLELLHIAEQAGVPIFNNSIHSLPLLNRLSCTLTLAKAGIPMPPTRITEDFAQALIAVEDFGCAVFKPLYSTKARGMTVISKKKEFYKIKQEIHAFQVANPVMYIQQKMQLGGQDLGLVFLAGQYLGCYARISKEGEWNTSTHNGGRYAAYQPSDEVIALAAKAQALFKLDFATVDIAETEAGAVVFEVSAFGGFKGAKEGIGIDVPQLYADYVVNTLLAKRQ